MCQNSCKCWIYSAQSPYWPCPPPNWVARSFIPIELARYGHRRHKVETAHLHVICICQWADDGNFKYQNEWKWQRRRVTNVVGLCKRWRKHKRSFANEQSRQPSAGEGGRQRWWRHQRLLTTDGYHGNGWPKGWNSLPTSFLVSYCTLSKEKNNHDA